MVRIAGLAISSHQPLWLKSERLFAQPIHQAGLATASPLCQTLERNADINSIWIFVLSVAAPIAGVVGFSIQLREVKKTRLENEKLLLEIQELKTKARASEQRIVQATNEEVLRISHPDVPMFSRRARTQDHEYIHPNKKLRERAIESLIVLAAFLVLAYFVYDLYRLFHWLANAL